MFYFSAIKSADSLRILFGLHEGERNGDHHTLYVFKWLCSLCGKHLESTDFTYRIFMVESTFISYIKGLFL